MNAIDHTHDPEAGSWVPEADGHPDFPVQNLPFGLASVGKEDPFLATAIGDYVLDLTALAAAGLLPAPLEPVLAQHHLNGLFALPATMRRALRHGLFELLTAREHAPTVIPMLQPAGLCHLHLPFRIGDYTDFYAGIHHATNIGRQFRPATPLLDNYKHVPIAYHGRASSVWVSGHPVPRPQGQSRPASAAEPSFGPSRRLDYELELGFWITGENRLGESVPIAEAGERIGGFCLLNDWSARDLQAWEYQPLGPFLAKSFLTTVSPWVVTAEALAPFRIAQPARPAGDPAPLPYLRDERDQAEGALALRLEVFLSTERMRFARHEPHRLSAVMADQLYWTPAQMVAHQTANGCNLRPGDLLGSGTISGPARSSFGSLAELSNGGSQPLLLPDGESRCFLQDGDEITFTAQAERAGYRTIGFGPCSGRVGEGGS